MEQLSDGGADTSSQDPSATPGFWDTFQSRAAAVGVSAVNTVGDFFDRIVTDPQVRLGNMPAGNLTPAQIAAGMFGTPPKTAAPRQGTALVSNIEKSLAGAAPLILAGLVLLLVLNRGKK